MDTVKCVCRHSVSVSRGVMNQCLGGQVSTPQYIRSHLSKKYSITVFLKNPLPVAALPVAAFSCECSASEGSAVRRPLNEWSGEVRDRRQVRDRRDRSE